MLVRNVKNDQIFCLSCKNLIRGGKKTYIFSDSVKLDENKEKTNTKIVNLGELWITREKDEPKNALFLSPEDSKPLDEDQDWDYIGARYNIFLVNFI